MHVVLLSALPQAHARLLRSLRVNGVRVHVLRAPARAFRLLKRGPTMVLVDLVHGSGLNQDAVTRLNRARGQNIVVALHEGGFGHFHQELQDLCVDGFCRAEHWRPIAGYAGHAPSASHAIH